MTDNDIQGQYFSDYFNLDKSKLDELGVFDPILNLDTPVFVDPFLLKDIQNEHFTNSYQIFKEFFRKFLKRIKLSKHEGDIPWNSAYKQLNDYMGEYQFSCIGFGVSDTSGRGSGKKISYKLLQRAKNIIDYDPDDPEIFSLLPLFEDDIGADRISDMTQNIIDDDICAYTEWVLKELGLCGNYTYSKTRLDKSFRLLKNPFLVLPIKLLPKTLLTDLPIASNIKNIVYEATSHNQFLRDQISAIVGKEWEHVTKQEAIPEIFDHLEKDNPFFVELLKNINKITIEAYNLNQDVKGLYRWLNDALKFDLSAEITHQKRPINHIDDLFNFVTDLTKAFIQQIDKGLYRLYWKKDKNILQHPKQSYSEHLFFHIVNFYFDSKNTDISFSSNDEGFKHYKFSCNHLSVNVVICHANNTSLKEKYEMMLKRVHKSGNTKFIIIILLFSSDIPKPLNKLRGIKNLLCPIYEVNIPKPQDKDILVEYEGKNESEQHLAEMRKKGGVKRHERTNNIKNKIIMPMYPIVKAEEAYASYQNIGTAIHEILINLDINQIDTFMKTYSINPEDKSILLDAQKYSLERDGSTIVEWCRQKMKDEKKP